jgi:hypothetical protein
MQRDPQRRCQSAVGARAGTAGAVHDVPSAKTARRPRGCISACVRAPAVQHSTNAVHLCSRAPSAVHTHRPQARKHLTHQKSGSTAETYHHRAQRKRLLRLAAASACTRGRGEGALPFILLIAAGDAATARHHAHTHSTRTTRQAGRQAGTEGGRPRRARPCQHSAWLPVRPPCCWCRRLVAGWPETRQTGRVRGRWVGN